MSYSKAERQRRADVFRRPGCRHARYAYSNRRLIAVYDGEPQGFDTDGGRWQLVCEDHGWILSFPRLIDAVRWMPRPEEWCERCAGTEPE